MLLGENIDEVRLDEIGILVLVDEDELKLGLVVGGELGVRLEKEKWFFEEVIEVDRIGDFLLGLVMALGGGDRR